MNKMHDLMCILYMSHPRKLVDGSRYHVIARANRKEMILHSVAMKDLFIETVARAKEKYDFKVDNFVIMGNHFHMILTPGKDVNLFRIMQWIMSVFAMRFNRIHHLSGHVWGGRFFSRQLGLFWEYLRVFEYIDENPVRACQVKTARDWNFGGLRHRQLGWRSLVDGLPGWLQAFFPLHQPCLLT